MLRLGRSAVGTAAVLVLGCASAGGVVWHDGVTVYDGERAAPDDRWAGGSFADVPVLVVREDGNGTGVTTDRMRTIREAMYNAGTPRLLEIVEEGQARGDTLASILWQRGRNDMSPFEGWVAATPQRTAIEAGGNAILLTHEAFAGGFRGFGGVILRCPDGPSGPVCT